MSDRLIPPDLASDRGQLPTGRPNPLLQRCTESWPARFGRPTGLVVGETAGVALLDARPPQLDLTLYAGDDTTITLTVVDDDGAPVDLTGEVVAQVRRKPADVASVCEPAVANPDGASGVISVTFTAADTTAMIGDGGYHHWDVQHAGASGVETLVVGNVRTEQDVTRP